MLEAKQSSEQGLTNLGCLGVKEIDTEPIKCIAVNNFKPNLVVTGGSLVLLHNFDKGFSEADTFTPTQEAQDPAPVVAVAWNYKVAHIFASAADNGVTTVWDVKSKKSIMSVTDGNFGLDSFSTEGAQYSHKIFMRLVGRRTCVCRGTRRTRPSWWPPATTGAIPISTCGT